MRCLNKFIRLSYFLILTISFYACEDDFEPVYQVDPQLQPFIDTFLDEANSRGFDYKIDNLIMEYDSTMNVAVCGTCNSHSKSEEVQKIIKINPFCSFEYNEQWEALIFHELGHCFLGRPHTSELLPNGAPKSMMVPNNFNIYAPCIYQIGEEECNFTYRRTYYINELFDENTPVPEWAK